MTLSETPTANFQPAFRQYLKAELARRCQANPMYSLRAFARALQVDPSALSKMLSGSKVPARKMALKLVSKLDLGPSEQTRFLRSLGFDRIEASTRPTTTDLTTEIYRIIADWYHSAILELTYQDAFRADPTWIASQLGISAAEAKLALERLLELGLLAEDAGGRIRKSNEQLDTIDKHITTPAHRKNQRQFLEKAIHSLENDPIDERDMSSMTMSIDPDRLPAARRMIQEFRQALCLFLESGPRKRVFNLELALYPLQRNERKK